MPPQKIDDQSAESVSEGVQFQQAYRERLCQTSDALNTEPQSLRAYEGLLQAVRFAPVFDLFSGQIR